MSETIFDGLRQAVSAALAGSAEGRAEIMADRAESFSVGAFRGEIASFSRSGSGGLAARSLKGSRLGRSYSERLDAEAARAALAQAARNADFLDEDPGNALGDGRDAIEQVEGADAPLLGDGEAKRFVLDLEEACKAADPRVINVPMAQYGWSKGLRVVANERGLFKAYADFNSYAYAYVMASDGASTETGVYVIAGRGPIDGERIAREAVARAIAKLGGVQPSSGTYRCVLDGEQAGELLGPFMANIDAEVMQKGASRLAGKVGQTVGSSLFTIVDDPRAPGLGKRRFDDEGIDSPAIRIFDAGVFASPLYTLYSASREGRASNGRGFCGGIQARTRASAINAFIPDGGRSREELLRDAGSGILITELEGLHAGLDPVSGDFSCAAKGFRIEGGAKGEPLRNFTVAGNFYDLIKAIVGVANDRRKDSLTDYSSPSLLIEALAISGS